MPRLGVNVDHVATVRQARRATYPDPVEAARVAEDAGADSITAHLREDRRHIQDDDVERLARAVRTKLNLELAVSEEIVAIAVRLRPADACVVPERREEITTEGGLDVVRHADRVGAVVRRLGDVGVRVSLFVDPDPAQLEAAVRAGAPVVELHTGDYANAVRPDEVARELDRLHAAARAAHELGLQVNAGHGLTLANVGPVARLPHMDELNIGHSIVSRALLVGMAEAVREMKRAIG